VARQPQRRVGVTARLPSTISLMRRGGTVSAFASRYWHAPTIPRGERERKGLNGVPLLDYHRGLPRRA
jgi:hypothetical protein